MTTEGKVLGYDKKTVTWAVIAVILALVVFYAGAEYEKDKLVRLGVCKGGVNYSSSSATGKAKKHKKKVLPVTTPGTGTTTPTTNQTPATGTTNAATGKASTSNTSGQPTTPPAAPTQTPGTGATN